MKNFFVFLFTIIILANLSSAYSVEFGSIGDILNQFDASTIILSILFIISYIIISFVLTSIFGKENKPTANVIAGAVSILLIYGVNLLGIDYEMIFINFGTILGFDTELIYASLPIIVAVVFIILLVRIGLGTAFLISGIFLIILSFFAFEKTLLMTIGGFLLIIGFIMMLRKKKDSLEEYKKVLEKSQNRGGINTKKIFGGTVTTARGTGKVIKSGWRFGKRVVGTGWDKTKSASNAWRQRKEEQKMREAKEAHDRAMREAVKKMEEQKMREAKEAHDKAMQRAIEEGKRKDGEKNKMKLIEDKRTKEEKLKSLIREYNKIQSKNPGDVRLKNLVEEIKKLRKS